jgi:SAM-dependent methyltransferase
MPSSLDTYKALCTEFYDLDKPEVPSDSFAFYLKFAKEAQGSILEPMCGTGRFLIPLLEQGFDVEGLDASSHMLDALRQKCVKKGLCPIIYEQFLQDFNPQKQYALIFIPAGSFSLLVDESQAKEVLQLFYKFLQPNGKLVFEVETLLEIPKQPGVWQGSWVERLDGSKIIGSSLPLYDAKNQILSALCRYELMQDNQIIRQEIEYFRVRLYGSHEMDRWFHNAGFKVIKRWKTYDSLTAAEDEIPLAYECQK